MLISCNCWMSILTRLAEAAYQNNLHVAIDVFFLYVLYIISMLCSVHMSYTLSRVGDRTGGVVHYWNDRQALYYYCLLTTVVHVHVWPCSSLTCVRVQLLVVLNMIQVCGDVKPVTSHHDNAWSNRLNYLSNVILLACNICNAKSFQFSQHNLADVRYVFLSQTY